MDAVISRLNAALEGRYVVERPLGEGGMATVHLADDVRHGRILALHRGRGTSLNAHTMRLVTDWRRGLAGGG